MVDTIIINTYNFNSNGIGFGKKPFWKYLYIQFSFLLSFEHSLTIQEVMYNCIMPWRMLKTTTFAQSVA